MLSLKTLPGKLEVQLPKRDWLQGLATSTDSFVAEALIRHGEIFCGPFHQNLRGNSGEFSAQSKGGEQMIDVAYAGGQHIYVPVAIFVHSLDVLNHVHAVFAVIVEPADKWRYVYRRL